MRTQTITVTEDIVLFEHKVNTFVRILLGRGTVVDGKFQVFPDQNYDVIMIVDGHISLDYTELMSANPSWAPNKPAGVFRQEDLWHFVDLIRSRQ
jgi:hypothetical protein